MLSVTKHPHFHLHLRLRLHLHIIPTKAQGCRGCCSILVIKLQDISLPLTPPLILSSLTLTLTSPLIPHPSSLIPHPSYLSSPLLSSPLLSSSLLFSSILSSPLLIPVLKPERHIEKLITTAMNNLVCQVE